MKAGIARAFWPSQQPPRSVRSVASSIANTLAELAEIDPESYDGPWFFAADAQSQEPPQMVSITAEDIEANLLLFDEWGSLSGRLFYIWRTTSTNVDLSFNAQVGAISPYLRERAVLDLAPSAINDRECSRQIAEVLHRNCPTGPNVEVLTNDGDKLLVVDARSDSNPAV